MVLYDKTSELDNVDTARTELFCYGNKSVEKIHPHNVPLCSIRSMQHANLVFGLPVNLLISKGPRGLGLG